MCPDPLKSKIIDHVCVFQSIKIQNQHTWPTQHTIYLCLSDPFGAFHPKHY